MVAGVVLAGVVLAGCSSADAGTASASELESAAVSALKSQTGQDASVDCASSTLRLEVGQSVQCSARVGDGVDRSARVQVVSVDGDGYAVDVVLDPALTSQVPAVSGEEVQTMVSNELKSVTHVDPSVVCDDSLPRRVGASTSCQVKFVGEDQPRSGQVSVKSVSDQGVPSLDVKLSPSVADEPLSDSRGSVAGVVADALEGQLGERPKVDCGGGFVVLKNDQELSCDVSSVAGKSLGEAQVVLRDVSGGSYSVDVSLEQTTENSK
ncbi:Uncharacterised protein [Mycobacteroides abscessus subsp. abscessus]|nr:Uncharacterised protein [Mycobacteroides abscessus subsp. abscessus]